MKKYLHDTNRKYYFENICHEWFINYLYCWIYSSYILHKKLNKILLEPDWSFVSFWNLKSQFFIGSHSFSFVVPAPVIRYHLLSFVITRCHSLSLNLSLVAITCYSLSITVTRCNSLSLVAPLVDIYWTTHCHSLSLDVPLVSLFINDRFETWHTSFPWFYLFCLFFFIPQQTLKILFMFHLVKLFASKFRQWV